MNHHIELIDNELDVLSSLVPLKDARIIELGCGAAALARELMQRHPGASYIGYEVDLIQHGRNLQAPASGMQFEVGGAEKISQADAQFDLALMLKSLHHVPIGSMDQALREVARVLKPGGFLYVSEPLYEGALNDIVKLFNDEGLVRAEAQKAVDRATDSADARFAEVARVRFDMPVHFQDYPQFEQRMMRPTYKDHGIDAAMIERVRVPFEAHCGSDGAKFVRPMLVRLLQRTG